jgi:hypothetical protein
VTVSARNFCFFSSDFRGTRDSTDLRNLNKHSLMGRVDAGMGPSMTTPFPKHSPAGQRRYSDMFSQKMLNWFGVKSPLAFRDLVATM